MLYIAFSHGHRLKFIWSCFDRKVICDSVTNLLFRFSFKESIFKKYKPRVLFSKRFGGGQQSDCHYVHKLNPIFIVRLLEKDPIFEMTGVLDF